MEKLSRVFLFGCRLAVWGLLTMVLVYVAGVMIRVSLAESRFFGRSELLPMAAHPPEYDSRHGTSPYGEPAYVFDRNGRAITVWEQKIDGFQHLYGAGLVTIELNAEAANTLFCAVEFVEAGLDLVRDPAGITADDLRERKRDLLLNRTGIEMAEDLKEKGLNHFFAKKALIERILKHIETDSRWIGSARDARIPQLLSEWEYVCAGLPGVMRLPLWPAPKPDATPK